MSEREYYVRIRTDFARGAGKPRRRSYRLCEAIRSEDVQRHFPEAPKIAPGSSSSRSTPPTARRSC